MEKTSGGEELAPLEGELLLHHVASCHVGRRWFPPLECQSHAVCQASSFSELC